MKTKSHQVLSGKGLVGIELQDQLVPNCYRVQFQVDIVELNSQVQIICPLKYLMYFVNVQLKYVGWLNLNGTTLGTDYLDQTTANVCFSTNLSRWMWAIYFNSNQELRRFQPVLFARYIWSIVVLPIQIMYRMNLKYILRTFLDVLFKWSN